MTTPLTDERIQEIFDSVANDDPDVHIRFARAIEVAAIAALVPVAWQCRFADREHHCEDWVYLKPERQWGTVEEQIESLTEPCKDGKPLYETRELCVKETK